MKIRQSLHNVPPKVELADPDFAWDTADDLDPSENHPSLLARAEDRQSRKFDPTS
jgi:hypothetical protein